ncbi:hypothetical protein COLO4_21536 [Corchorus olitorius]|uniref:Uncharacterized protein n=1 Tax=Corchorus olitorius TaxID=93759 RepID=A0A1R3ISQ8_9ROSI|nr:hypothetical protein COLO4_21536 [Corchorus olitorius]
MLHSPPSSSSSFVVLHIRFLFQQRSSVDYESDACLEQVFDWLEEVLIQVIWGFTAVAVILGDGILVKTKLAAG